MDHLLLTEEEQILRSAVRELAQKELSPRAAQYDEEERFPWENVRALAEMGLMGLTLDPEYGGGGGTARQVVVAVEEIARACAATSTIYIAHLSLCAQFVDMYGSPQQKARWLPGLASGEVIGAFALTEPGCGSDAAAITTTLGRRDGGYALRGTKHFITNAVEAGLFVVMATHDRSLRTRGIDAVVVERDAPGLTINPQHGKLGIRASSTAEMVFEDCPVPAENLLGAEGEGFKEAMQVLNVSRISIAAQCVGLAQAAYEAALDYARQRRAFGQALADFQGIQWLLADMATEVEAARLLTYQAATLRDRGMPFITRASMAKLFASQVAVRATNQALQVHGGIGYFRPTPVERYFRDARVTEIYEGTTEIQRLIIARNILQGEMG